MAKKSVDLKPKERKYLEKYIEYDGDRNKAYSEVVARRSTNRKSINEMVCRYHRKVLAKLETSEVADLYNINKERFFSKLDEQLEATRPAHFGGKRIDDYADNSARNTALALAADVLGLRQKGASVDISATKNDTFIVIMRPEEEVRKEQVVENIEDYRELEDEIIKDLEEKK